MRIAVLSDIHGNLRALEAVVADARRRGVDAIVNLGDSLSGPLQPLETARYLMATGWVQLAGNHERQLLDFVPEERGASDTYAHSALTPDVFEWMASLPATSPFEGEVFLCHGSPRSDLEWFLETPQGTHTRPADATEVMERLGGVAHPVVVCGHTHLPRVLRSPSGQLLVNPGSVGLPAYDVEEPEPIYIENGSSDSRYAIVERASGTWRAELIAVPYDHEAQSKIAEGRGRRDWARALRTGYAR